MRRIGPMTKGGVIPLLGRIPTLGSAVETFFADKDLSLSLIHI